MGGGLVVENDRRKVAAAAMRGTDTGRLAENQDLSQVGSQVPLMQRRDVRLF